MGLKKKTFEQAFTRLEGLVRELENGQITLEQALDLYAEGVELIKHCREKLERAEQRMTILSKDIEGKPILEDTTLPESGRTIK
ncbi:MAG TPA: exodeoxyribonuclease VII small subunit [Clostridia bacterium]|nr:exodeoxyribonuclease VII small subunit [Clostridia bacterium]